MSILIKATSVGVDPGDEYIHIFGLFKIFSYLIHLFRPATDFSFDVIDGTINMCLLDFTTTL